MKTFQTRAIVIKKSRFSEGDAVATLFTEKYGKMPVIARKLYFYRNRHHGKFESCSLIDLTYSATKRGGLFMAGPSETLDAFRGLVEKPSRVFAAFYFLELIDSWLKENDPNPSAFHLLHASLSLLETMDSLDTLIRVFELRLLALTGYSPKLNGCVRCGVAPRDGTFRFSFEEGGIICPGCQDMGVASPRISLGSLNFANKGYVIKYPHIARLKIPRGLFKEIELLAHHFLVFKLGKELKSYRFLGLK